MIARDRGCGRFLLHSLLAVAESKITYEVCMTSRWKVAINGTCKVVRKAATNYTQIVVCVVGLLAAFAKSESSKPDCTSSDDITSSQTNCKLMNTLSKNSAMSSVLSLPI